MWLISYTCMRRTYSPCMACQTQSQTVTFPATFSNTLCVITLYKAVSRRAMIGLWRKLHIIKKLQSSFLALQLALQHATSCSILPMKLCTSVFFVFRSLEGHRIPSLELRLSENAENRRGKSCRRKLSKVDLNPQKTVENRVNEDLRDKTATTGRETYM